jgi:DHA1 family multidrug resistance protein-like MFS transporter
VAGYFHVSYLGIGLIFALFWGCRVISFSSSGLITEKIGRKPMLIMGTVFLGIAAIMFILGEGFLSITVAAILGGLGTGIIFPLLIAITADVASPGYSGFDMGALEFCGSIGMVAQTALSGILGQYRGVQMTYSFTLVVCLIGIVIAGVFVKDRTGHHKISLSE